MSATSADDTSLNGSPEAHSPHIGARKRAEGSEAEGSQPSKTDQPRNLYSPVEASHSRPEGSERSEAHSLPFGSDSRGGGSQRSDADQPRTVYSPAEGSRRSDAGQSRYPPRGPERRERAQRSGTAVTSAMRVSVVIPAYNEARRLPATLASWREFLSSQPFSWELIVVDDGSSDATATVALGSRTRVISLRPNRGKGGAVKAGVLSAASDVVAYVDADLNIAPNHLPRALDELERGADLVVGRRNLAEYATAEGPIRLVAGGLVQVTRRALVLRDIQDTQCGFKVFRGALAQAVFARTRIYSFAFDIEVLFLAERLGARIVELPVSTTYRAESTFKVRKHLPQFLADIVRIRLNALGDKYDGPRARQHTSAQDH